MRTILTTAAAAMLLATGLAGCNRGAPANQVSQNSASAPIDRGAIRELMLVGCRNGDANAAAQLRQAGIDLQQFCACSVDRYLQGASEAELQQMSSSPNQARLQAASEQCVAQMTGRSTGGALGNAAEAADGAAEEASDAAAEVENAAGGK